MSQLGPITDLRDTKRISNLCHEKNAPVFITKNGYGDLVVMIIKAYKRIMDKVSAEFAIKEAEDEYDWEGMLFDAEETMVLLRRKLFGQV